MDRREFVRVTGLASVGAWLLQGRGARAVEDRIPQECRVVRDWPTGSGNILLASSHRAATILVDRNDHEVVHLAAGLLAGDLGRITGREPDVAMSADVMGTAIIIGTLGQSRWVDQLVAQGRVNVKAIRGRWEASLWQTVIKPFPGIEKALVIAGNDRRGTAYGVMDLCEAAGVSPWYWWADVPVQPAAAVSVTRGRRLGGEPGVKYRGIFINDEDWGFEPWAAETMDPELGNVGPKTYRKVFELMLRLKLNYLWPAMHPCSTPFAAIPENSVLANQYAIVMGSSHVEPMLANPASFLKDKSDGPWNFVTNGRKILNFWRRSVESRGKYEAIWTIGMRGPVDGPLLGVHGIGQERSLVQKIIAIQRSLLRRYVTRRWGPVAECYVPYKEALLVFNSGLEVPPDVTLIWPDNNFGYVRQLSNPQQRMRSGGSGVYYHLEYLGAPHSYCWLNTTPPALAWEELKKAWDNGARTIWVINVGGIKPREVGMDFAARLAWNPEGFGPDAQPRFLQEFAATACGAESAQAVAELMADYYELGQIRRPESMNREWAASLPNTDAQELLERYHQLLAKQSKIAQRIPQQSQDAFFELFGYAAQMLAATGLIFLYDRLAHTDQRHATEHEKAVQNWRAFIEQKVAWYNDKLAGGKWRGYATMGGTTLDVKWAAVQWPWLHPEQRRSMPRPEPKPLLVMNANDFVRCSVAGVARWQPVQGLGRSGHAMALWPAVAGSQWNPATQLGIAPKMEYSLDVPVACAEGALILYVLPTYELHPGMKLRVAVSWDHHAPQTLEVPRASSETRVVSSSIRSAGVLNNRIPLRVPIGPITAGKHALTIHAVDPGVVLDQIAIMT